MRSESKILAEDMPQFMDARIKIHGKPSVSDIKMVQDFRVKNKNKITPKLAKQFDELEKTMVAFYAPIDFKKLESQINQISFRSDVTQSINDFLKKSEKVTSPEILVTEIADILCLLRQEIPFLKRSSDKLLLLDFSNELEDILLLKSQEWQPETLKGLLNKIQIFGYAATGTGLIEVGEWAAIEPYLLADSYHNDKSIGQLNDFLSTARGLVE